MAVPVTAERWDMAFRVEAGSFNKAYQDREYVTSTMVTLGVPYGAVGGEVRHTDDEGNSWALGLAQTTIGQGQVYNWDRWESQPLTALSFASLSAGKDWGWWEAGLGVGALVRLRDFDAMSRYSADGSTTTRAGGLDWDRRESFALVTGLLRLLPLDQPHMELRVARGPLSLTENLMHVKAVLPLGSTVLDAEIGFSSPMGLFFSGDGQLRNNERVSLGWAWAGPTGQFGLRAGYLLRTLIAGSGEVDLLRRLSVAVDWSMSADYGSTLPAAR